MLYTIMRQVLLKSTVRMAQLLFHDRTPDVTKRTVPFVSFGFTIERRM